MLRKILIANRGEITVRIIHAARAMGISTVAVFSEADSDALHVRLADESRCIGPAPSGQSYLDPTAIINAAVETGAQAIHPGYGFLSESAQFAENVASAGLGFVGPTATTLNVMGDKIQARRVAISAGVPVLPGSEGPVDDLLDSAAIARSIGYPIAIKASFGGGGRGMRIAPGEQELEEAMAAARREAGAAFGRSEIYLEKFLPAPRHVEVQILGDKAGRIVHLGDRDCTVQRRHQKLLEEAPAPALDAALRTSIHRSALALARRVDYVGAGTVEFLVDPATNAFFFLEMNTRLQVEHGVTELVTGIDIVEQQIRIESGYPLDFDQNEIRLDGHAIQARIAAENPWEDFAPDSGTVSLLDLPFAPWTRADFGLQSGDRVEPYYDSLIGKLLAWAPDRAGAISRLMASLDALRVEGVATTAPYLAQVLRREEFQQCRHFTGSVERDWLPAGPPPSASGAVARKDAVLNVVSERRVSLPSAPHGSIAIYGLAPSPAVQSISSSRPARSGDSLGQRDDSSAGAKVVTAPMNGILVQTRAEIGDEVAMGHPLLVLEAMKMEVIIRAPIAGKLKRLSSEIGSPVYKGQIIVEFE